MIKCNCGRSLNRKKPHQVPCKDIMYDVHFPYRTHISIDKEIGVFYAMCSHGRDFKKPTYKQWLKFFERAAYQNTTEVFFYNPDLEIRKDQIIDPHKIHSFYLKNKIIKCKNCKKTAEFIPDTIWYPWKGDLLLEEAKQSFSNNILQFYSQRPLPPINMSCYPNE